MTKLHLLLLEDSPLDAELILTHLTDGGFDCAVRRVQTRADFQTALQEECADLILADFSLPAFDGISALKLAQEHCPHVPFIFVSGAMGEEVAIETLKSGATDYVLKQRLERLVPAVRRALREAAERAERRRLEEVLRLRMEELAEADQRKDEFLALLSHELRNPLAPVRNALQIMRLHGMPDPIIDKAHQIITRQVEHLSRLVDDLLDVSRITRGKIQLRKQRVDLSAVAGQAIDIARPLIEERQHHVEVSLSPEPLGIDADPVRLEQVISNLLTNAAKYTDPGGRIWLTTRREGDQAVLHVRDSGIGITPEMLPRVFDLFIQAERSLDRSEGGLGIGLTLVRRLVEMHGGSIRARSEGPGQGSEFCVRLPVAPPREEDDCPPAVPAVPATGPPRRSRRVVVVDDNKDGADSLAMLLRLWSHEVVVVHDGPTALRVIQSCQPDVVLLDIGLPGMDGYEVAQRLRRELRKQPLLVALTGYGHDEDRRRSREVGFDHHLIKPVDPEELRQVLALDPAEPAVN